MDLQQIYQRIAREHHTTVASVKEEIQRSIQEAWAAPNKSEAQKKMQESIPRAGDIPTPDELIIYLSSLHL